MRHEGKFMLFLFIQSISGVVNLPCEQWDMEARVVEKAGSGKFVYLTTRVHISGLNQLELKNLYPYSF